MTFEHKRSQVDNSLALTPPLGEIPRDTRGRIRWKIVAQDQEKVVQVVEALARDHLESGGEITQSSLTQAKGLTRLAHVIPKYYPGGMHTLREKLGAPIPQVRRGYWQRPEALDEIRGIAAQVLQKEGRLDVKTLTKHVGKRYIGTVAASYPGRLTGLKIDLGLDPKIGVGKFWTPERIEQEASAFIEREGGLTQALLRERKAGKLNSAIDAYPGGMTALKKKLGIEPGRKPNGYWTKEVIEQKAREFLSREGKLNQTILYERGEVGLAGAINKNYPGKMPQLKKNLGAKIDRRNTGSWTKEQIAQEAADFYTKEGRLTHTLLIEKESAFLSVAITRRYPGGMSQLLEDIGVKCNKRRNGYWTKENIEKEAQSFYEEHGMLTYTALTHKKQDALGVAINKHYPGGIGALKESLKITMPSEVTEEEANAELDKLLEGHV
jgi:hypothetical protein